MMTKKNKNKKIKAMMTNLGLIHCKLVFATHVTFLILFLKVNLLRRYLYVVAPTIL